MRYGPYSLGEVPEHDNLKEVPVVPQIKYLMMRYYQDRARQATVAIEENANEKVFKEANKAFKGQAKLR